MMELKSFYKTVFAVLNVEIGVNVLTAVTSIILARNLNVHNYGIYSLAVNFPITLCYLSGFGLPQAIIYFIGRRKSSAPQISFNFIILIIMISLVVSILVYSFRTFFLNSFLKDIPISLFSYILGLYFFLMLESIILSALRAVQKFAFFNLKRIATASITFLIILLIIFLNHAHLKTIIFTVLAVNGILTIFFMLTVLSKSSLKLELQGDHLKNYFKYGMKSHLQLVVVHLIYRMDLYMIAYFMDTQYVAYYNVAVGIASLLTLLPATAGTVLFPTLTNQNSDQEIHQLSANVCRNTLFITTITALVLVIVGQFVITFFYGADYTPSIYALLILIPGIVAMSVFKILTRNFSSRNRHHLSLIIAIISLLINLGLNFALIPHYGIEGAAVASLIAYFLAGATLTILFKVESNIPFRDILLINKSDLVNYRQIYYSCKNKLSRGGIHIR